MDLISKNCDKLKETPDTNSVQETIKTEPKLDITLGEMDVTSQNREKRFKNEFIEIASRLVAAGFSETELAWVFRCAPTTIKTWKARYPQFEAACEDGKRVIKRKLVAVAIREAMGYSYESSKRKIIRGADGVIIKDEETVFTNKTPVNPNILIFLLCNLARQLGDNDWASKHTMEMADGGVSIKIEGKLEGERIATLAGKLLQEAQKPVKFVESQVIENKL